MQPPFATARPSQRAFRFGVSIFGAASAAEWAAKARHAEALGYDTLSIPDHLIQGLYSPIAALCSAAEATTRLRVGTLVLNNDLRHPALIAREAATLDLLSGGRLELGLGAGHMQHELESIGMSFDAPAVRIARLGEAVDVMRRLFTGEALTFAGQHYTLREHQLFPRPIQRALPLLIGGNGRPLLQLAARNADIVGFTGFFPKRGGGVGTSHFSAAGFARRLDIVREAAAERFHHLELHALLQAVIVTDDPRAAAERLQPRSPSLSIDEILGSPFLLIGSIDQMVQSLLERRERFGLSYFTTFEPGLEALAKVIARLGSR